MVKQHILLAQYEDVVGDNVINLAVVLEDTATQERFLSSEEFSIASPQLAIEVPNRSKLRFASTSARCIRLRFTGAVFCPFRSPRQSRWCSTRSRRRRSPSPTPIPTR